MNALAVPAADMSAPWIWENSIVPFANLNRVKNKRIKRKRQNSLPGNALRGVNSQSVNGYFLCFA